MVEERMNVKISSQTHKKLKVLSAYQGKSMSEIIDAAVEQLFQRSGLPEPEEEKEGD